MLKVNNKITILEGLKSRDFDVILVFLLLTLNIFHAFLYYFYCLLRTNYYLLGKMIFMNQIPVCKMLFLLFPSKCTHGSQLSVGSFTIERLR